MRAVYSIIVSSDLAEIGRVAESVNQFTAANAVDSLVSHRMNVVLDDVLSNIMSHGYANPVDHVITIEFNLGSKQLDVVVTDDGRPFDPLSHRRPNPRAGLEEFEIGGLGIELIRQLTHKVNYRRCGDQNILTLTFCTETNESHD